MEWLTILIEKIKNNSIDKLHINASNSFNCIYIIFLYYLARNIEQTNLIKLFETLKGNQSITQIDFSGILHTIFF